MSTPFQWMVPLVGRYTPQTVLNKVVLPDPFGPMTPRISSERIVISTPASATTPPKVLRRPVISSVAIVGCVLRSVRYEGRLSRHAAHEASASPIDSCVPQLRSPRPGSTSPRQ